MRKILIGNTFPLVLIRRNTLIKPVPIRKIDKRINVYSFWGHANTLKVASEKLGVDLTPKEVRPAIGLNERNLPLFLGEVFREVYVFNPDYKGTYRPKIGEEVGEDMINGWTMLLIRFL